MTKTQTFEKLDELTNNLKGLGTLSNEEFKKTPQYRKWEQAFNKLPEEERKEYEEHSEKNREKNREQQSQYLKELCEHKKLHPYTEEWLQKKLEEDGEATEEAPSLSSFRDHYPEFDTQDLSNKRTVFFTFVEAVKKKQLDVSFNFANQQVKLEKEKNNGKSSFANLYIPETVSIDYSEYSNIPMFKNNIYAKPYRDGIMLITDIEKKNRLCVPLTVGTVKENEEAPQVDGKIIAGIYESAFRNFGQIDWTDKNFDEQVVFYVVVPKIVKNKAARIVFRDNIHLTKVIKLFRSESQRKLPSGEFKHFYDSTTAAHVVLAGLHVCREQTDPIKASNFKKSYDYNNRELLNAGYQGALIELANNGVLDGGDNILLTEKDFWSAIEKYKNKSLKEIKQEYMKDIFPFEKDLDLASLQSIDHKDKKASLFFNKNVLKMVTFYYHTNKGTTLCDGTKINIDIKTKSDCFLFWKKIDLFELLFNVLNDKNFPLCLRDSQIINDADIFDSVLEPHISLSPISDVMSGVAEYSKMGRRPQPGASPALPRFKNIPEFEFKNKHILKEAIDNQTGHQLVPWDGVFELLHDPFFKGIRFREYEDVVTAVILDKNERYFIEVFSKKEVDFKYMLWNQMKLNKHYSEECMQEIYTKIATVIRDSYVLIERDRTMGYGGKRRPYGMNTDSEYNIYYFPRKRYRYKNNGKAKKAFFRETRKFSGTRRAHIRELPENYKPSDKQLLLAKSLDIYVPPGCTFVEEAKWGISMTKKEIKYRHTCLNDLFYYDNREVSKAHEINQLSPAGFEEHCEARVKESGYSVKSCQNHDGGIDIRATKVLDNGEVEYLQVQCKHWKKHISLGAMKEFKASCDEEQSEYRKIKIFMTSSKYSSGAKTYAENYNIELIDGDDLLK